VEIDANTTCLGLLGNPVAHSLSPLLHNYVLNQMGLNYVYLPFQIMESQLKHAVNAIRSLNFRGVNVTIPYKEKVIPYLDEVDPEALDCGAVNVIKNEAGKLVGYNTDGQGFVASLREKNVPIKGRVLFLGAGGAARSLAWALAAAGVEHIDLMDINQERAYHLAKALSGTVKAEAYLMNEAVFSRLAQFSNIIINCTPVGMYPRITQSPVENLEMLQPGTVLCDIIYNPLQTKFLRLGQAVGLKTINGLPMFVHQAALSLEIWLGIKPSVQLMKEVLLNVLD